MATVTRVQLTDDLTGRPADQTIRFALDGTQYEIDLSDDNATKLRDALAVFVAHGRVQQAESARRVSPPTTARRSSKGELVAIREWAASSGIDLPSRGRIPEQVRGDFRAAWREANPDLTYDPAVFD